MSHTIFNIQVCDGVKDCDRICDEDDEIPDFKECTNDEDPTSYPLCSVCPKADGIGYPIRQDTWSANHLCYHDETGLPMCGIPCDGRKDCPGKHLIIFMSDIASRLYESI